MESTASQFTYQETGLFNEIVNDYTSGAAALQPFYEHPVSLDGFKAAIAARQQFPGNRNVLADVLEAQYEALGNSGAPVADRQRVLENIRLLRDADSFTVCTAHQPNIFSGYLYFIYKIMHAIRLAEYLKDQFPGKHFVPFFYMGSEDADLEELGKIFLNGEKLVWDTRQTGAVGRMNTKGLDALVHRISGELGVEPFGTELISLIRRAYLQQPDIQTATFYLIHELFAQYGLVVLIADHPELKKLMTGVFREDLFEHVPSTIVTETTSRLSVNYKVQANPRAINLFYLKDNIRNRIEKAGDEFVVVDTPVKFSAQELEEELNAHPERFSPNVILRGLYQETILPNIAFIGGGGELAYWLELKDLFHHYKVPYPVQVLRNSLLLIEPKWKQKMLAMQFPVSEFFKPSSEILNDLVRRNSEHQLDLSKEIKTARDFYASLGQVAGNIDRTLVPNVEAQEKKVLKQLAALEKKLLRAEKRKFEDQSRQIETIKNALFPRNGLQERIENFMPFYARYGAEWLNIIYRHSPAIDQRFLVVDLSK